MQPPEAPSAAARPRARSARRKAPARWTPRREDRFLAHLAECANITASAKAAKVSVSSVYRHRTRSAAFRTRWEDALAEGVVTLRTLLLDRAINGVERPVWHGGKQVGVAREWSDRLALALLAAHERRVAPTDPAAAAPLGDEAVAAELAARLAEMNLRLGGEG